ncbi:MAG: glycosyl hydrolase [Acidobacteria bacterium]|nr:glycosyl hydrolase [Acidobacteriota bacterium]
MLRWACVPIVVTLLWGWHASVPLAQSGVYDASLFKALKWRSIGPNRGGRSIAVAGSAARPLEYYLGAVGGGLWKTTDGGNTWRPVTDGQLRSSSVGAVAVAETNPDVVYVGMGETCLRGNIMQGDGVYKSTDGGQTWTNVGLRETHAIAKIRIDPTNPDVVYVAAFGHPPAPQAERGVFRTRDGGKTWEKVLFRDAKTGAIDVAVDRRNPRVIYAALWEAYRVSWQMSSGGPGSGLFKSSDGGTTWTEITRNPGLPAGVIGRIGVTVSAADSERVYALVEAEAGGVYRSDDAGATWTRVNEERKLRQRAFYYTHIFADPKDRETVYALNTGFYKSTDGGKTFPTQIQVPHGDNHDLWIDPTNPLRMINGNDGGGTVSVNGGQTWTPENYPTAQLYHVATTKEFPYHVCGAQQDNTTVCVPSSDWASLRMPRFDLGGLGDWYYQVGGGESGYIAPHPKTPTLFYAGSQGALITRYDRSNGQVRDIQPYPRFFSGEPSKDLRERWQWTYPIVFSPHDANVLYISSQHLWKTTSDGQGWEKISPDLTRADPKTLDHSGGPITHDENGPEVFGTIFAIAPSKHDANTIWTGSDDGVLYITRDGGKNWTNITPKDLPEFARVSIIEASPHKAGTAYVAAKRYLLDDRAPYVYRTDDYGQTWTKIVSGIRADDYAHAVREDPKRAGLLYAGTEHGIYVSFDDGARWQSLSLNLPDTQVSDIVVEENDVVIGTHGRSAWVLDDIDPIRQLTPAVPTSALHLFRPRDAHRSVNNAPIYYHLKQPADKVVVEILDAAGVVIQTYTGTPEDEKKRREEPSSFGPQVPPPPTTQAGLNRFDWNLRYAGATTFPGMILWSARVEVGPVAVPGPYQVRLTALGQTATERFAVKMDPRLKGVTVADLKTQFDLAMEIRGKTSEANEAVIRIRELKKQVVERLEKARSPKNGANAKLAAAADAFTKKLSAVEEEIYQVRNQSSQDPLNFPIKLNNRIAALGRSVTTGDARPTDGAYQVFKELSAELAEHLGRLDQAAKADLAPLNKLLAARKLPPVTEPAKKIASTEP